MGETPVSTPDAPASSTDSGQSAYEEYGDVLSDVMKDQERRTELRGQTSGPRRIHPAIPPVLALFSIWLWVLPPAMLTPEVPSTSPVHQEAGLRMGMYVLSNNIRRFEAENGRLPGDLQSVGGSPEGVAYLQMSSSVFRLSGQSGDIMVEYTSTEPVEKLLADAVSIVSGIAPSPSEGGPSS